MSYNIYSKNSEIQTQLPIILQAPKFKQYLLNLDMSVLDVKGIEITGVKWFCNPMNPVPDKLGFLYIELIATDKRNGKPVNGTTFLRGSSVAIYLRVKYNSKVYVVLVKQLRGPIGRITFEIPAGMMDAQLNKACGVAINEIREETGIELSEDILIPLGKFYASPGGSDEEIETFYAEVDIDEERFVRIQSETYGSEKENESIQIILVPEEDYEEMLETKICGAKEEFTHCRAIKKRFV